MDFRRIKNGPFEVEPYLFFFPSVTNHTDGSCEEANHRDNHNDDDERSFGEREVGNSCHSSGTSEKNQREQEVANPADHTLEFIHNFLPFCL